MKLHQQIAALRKSKGLTQEELAALTSFTIRTIQRIESGESNPRSFTLKAIAKALDTPYEYFNTGQVADADPGYIPAASHKDSLHTLQLVNLFSFFYLIIPFVHFLLQERLVDRSPHMTRPMIDFGRKIIRQQIHWVIATILLMLLTLAWNFVQAQWSGKEYILNYMWPFFFMYFLNAAIIFNNALQIRRFRTQQDAATST